MTFRDFPISAKDVETVEDAMYALYRARENELAMRLGVLALRMHEHTKLAPSNVVPLDTYSRKVG